jgi:endonuclease YncB( thermonuclease family)
MAGFLTPALASPRQEVIRGPITGRILQVLDGDTVNVSLHVWIGQEIETSIRVDGIDAPEIHGKCNQEREMAAAARDEMSRLLHDREIRIYNIRLEKYAGRVLATAETTDGIDIAKHMIEKGLARPYHGKKRSPWCSL